MASFLLKRSFHTELCQRMMDDIQLKRANYHYFLGRIAPWNEFDVVPGTIADTHAAESITRSEIVSIKILSPSDVSFVVRRYDWTINTVYAQYDSTIDISGLNFYAMTDEFNVYKCLSNNFGAQSINKPTGNSIQPIHTGDGYVWKYLYNIAPYKRAKFISPTRIPVQRALSDRFYNTGSIDSVSITNPGSGYTDTLPTYITVTGGTVGSGAILGVTVTLGILTGINVLNQGSGYTKGARITIGGFGFGAAVTPIITAGKIVGATIDVGGAGYTQDTTTAIVSVGGAVVIPSVSKISGSITRVTVLDTGIGYSSMPVLAVVGSPGTALYPENSSAKLKSIISGGKLVNVSIEDPGQNYPTDNVSLIDVIGDGSGAEFSPVIHNGKVIDIVIENPGIGYTYANLTINGLCITNAKAVAVLSESQLNSDQSVIEQTTINGGIHNVLPLVGGTNYTFCTALVVGDGSGAAVVPNIVGGVIVSYTVTNVGKNYTFANIVLSGDNHTNNPNATDATAYAVISPPGGHGRDAVSELYADRICLFSNIRYDGTVPAINQDFREYGLIKNIRDITTGNAVNNDYGLCTYTLSLNNTTGLVKDEILYNLDSKFRVVDILDQESKVIVTQLSQTPLSGITVLTASSNISRSYTVTGVLTVPVADKYSGQLLFVSDSGAFSFTNDQEVTIKTFLKL